MDNSMQLNKPQIGLDSTTRVETESGSVIFQQGFILRKVSKFLIGADEDGLIPLQVYYDPSNNKILKETLPPELHEEYKDNLA